jgi:hypothetical protein
MYRAIFAIAFALFVVAMAAPAAITAYKVAHAQTAVIEKALQQAEQ